MKSCISMVRLGVLKSLKTLQPRRRARRVIDAMRKAQLLRPGRFGLANEQFREAPTAMGVKHDQPTAPDAHIASPASGTCMPGRSAE